MKIASGGVAVAFVVLFDLGNERERPVDRAGKKCDILEAMSMEAILTIRTAAPPSQPLGNSIPIERNHTRHFSLLQNHDKLSNPCCEKRLRDATVERGRTYRSGGHCLPIALERQSKQRTRKRGRSEDACSAIISSQQAGIDKKNFYSFVLDDSPSFQFLLKFNEKIGSLSRDFLNSVVLNVLLPPEFSFSGCRESDMANKVIIGGSCISPRRAMNIWTRQNSVKRYRYLRADTNLTYRT